MLRVHKIRLQPTAPQAQHFAQACGVARSESQAVATEPCADQHFAVEGPCARRKVGVDLGLKALATFSDGSEPSLGPRALGPLLARLKRLSRAHSRKVKGSANRRKSAQRLARLHWRIACVRSDALHKLTDRLTKQYGWTAIEDLNVKGMLANHRLARHLADASFAELRRQLSYKAEQRGVHLAVVDRWYPSSKTCS